MQTNSIFTYIINNIYLIYKIIIICFLFSYRQGYNYMLVERTVLRVWKMKLFNRGHVFYGALYNLIIPFQPKKHYMGIGYLKYR